MDLRTPRICTGLGTQFVVKGGGWVVRLPGPKESCAGVTVARRALETPVFIYGRKEYSDWLSFELARTLRRQRGGRNRRLVVTTQAAADPGVRAALPADVYRLAGTGDGNGAEFRETGEAIILRRSTRPALSRGQSERPSGAPRRCAGPPRLRHKPRRKGEDALPILRQHRDAAVQG